MPSKGGLFTMLERVKRQLNRCFSYRGQNMRTCSTVSTLSGHEGHLSVLERCRLKRDWLSLERLKRSRASVEASDAESIVI